MGEEEEEEEGWLASSVSGNVSFRHWREKKKKETTLATAVVWHQGSHSPTAALDASPDLGRDRTAMSTLRLSYRNGYLFSASVRPNLPLTISTRPSRLRAGLDQCVNIYSLTPGQNVYFLYFYKPFIFFIFLFF